MDGNRTLLGAGSNLRGKLGLMMAASKGNLYSDLWVRLCVDYTQFHKRHFEHFMLRVLGSGNPLGSWCILHGFENCAVPRSLTRVSKMDEQVQETLNTKYEVQGGYMEKPHIFLVANVLARPAMADIKRWNCTSVDPVCWVCGKCRAQCDRYFGNGLSPILSHWTWYKQVLRSMLPKYRPPDYALTGMTRVTHAGLDGCWRALVQHHRFTKRRAVTWVHTHVDPGRVASNSIAPQDIAGQSGERPSLCCEQSAVFPFVSNKALGPLIVELNNESLLQHVVEGGHTWEQRFDWWWDCLHKSATIARKEGLLGAQEIDTQKDVLPQMAVHRQRCQLGQTPWVHLWVDHMLTFAKQWNALRAGVFGIFFGIFWNFSEIFRIHVWRVPYEACIPLKYGDPIHRLNQQIKQSIPGTKLFAVHRPQPNLRKRWHRALVKTLNDVGNVQPAADSLSMDASLLLNCRAAAENGNCSQSKRCQTIMCFEYL